MFHRMMNYGELEARPTAILTLEMIKERLPKYKRHDDLIIINERSWEEFKKLMPLPVAIGENSPFSIDEDELASLVCQSIHKPVCRRLAIESRVKNDDYRRPSVRMILGKNGIVRHRDNQITYQFDVTKCMFSFGNISEKMRMARLDCTQEVVVDLFAGIGYFTLPLLMHAKAKHLYACDWNPDSIEALRKNLILNKVKADSYTVIEGDNRASRPTDVAQRVILGILPSCKNFMKTALECVDKKTGAILHCHDLVETKTNSESCNESNEISYSNQSADLSNSSSRSTATTVTTSTTSNSSDFQSMSNQIIALNSTNSSLSTIDKLSAPLDDLRLQSYDDEAFSTHGLISDCSSGNMDETKSHTNGSSEQDSKEVMNDFPKGSEGDSSLCSRWKSNVQSESSNIGTHQSPTQPELSPRTNDNNDVLNSDSKFNNNNNNGIDKSNSEQHQGENSLEKQSREQQAHSKDKKMTDSKDDETSRAFEAKAQMLIACVKEDLDRFGLTARLLATHPVKSYAPHVYHVVFDIEIRNGRPV